jgi:hypothetical protein
MRKVHVSSFVQFITESDLLELISGLVLFRGQPVEGNLIPSIARKDPTENTTTREKMLLDQLRLMGASFLPSNEIGDLDLLVMAQHFGLKTRLLDWSSNPLAALWFACASGGAGDAFVYALDADGLLAEDVYKQDPFLLHETRVVQPRLNNPRILAQHGWFTLHRYATRNKRFVALEKSQTIKCSLTEYRIQGGKKSEILTALARHGVTNGTLFPDFHGLCAHLNWKHKLS